MRQRQNRPMQQKNDDGPLFSFTLLALHTNKLTAGLEGNVLCWQKWTGETFVGGIVRGKMSRVTLNVLHPCLINLHAGTGLGQSACEQIMLNHEDATNYNTNHNLCYSFC